MGIYGLSGPGLKCGGEIATPARGRWHACPPSEHGGDRTGGHGVIDVYRTRRWCRRTERRRERRGLAGDGSMQGGNGEHFGFGAGSKRMGQAQIGDGAQRNMAESGGMFHRQIGNVPPWNMDAKEKLMPRREGPPAKIVNLQRSRRLRLLTPLHDLVRKGGLAAVECGSEGFRRSAFHTRVRTSCRCTGNDVGSHRGKSGCVRAGGTRYTGGGRGRQKAFQQALRIHSRFHLEWTGPDTGVPSEGTALRPGQLPLARRKVPSEGSGGWKRKANSHERQAGNHRSPLAGNLLPPAANWPSPAYAADPAARGPSYRLRNDLTRPWRARS